MILMNYCHFIYTISSYECFDQSRPFFPAAPGPGPIAALYVADPDNPILFL